MPTNLKRHLMYIYDGRRCSKSIFSGDLRFRRGMNINWVLGLLSGTQQSDLNLVWTGRSCKQCFVSASRLIIPLIPLSSFKFTPSTDAPCVTAARDASTIRCCVSGPYIFRCTVTVHLSRLITIHRAPQSGFPSSLGIWWWWRQAASPVIDQLERYLIRNIPITTHSGVILQAFF